MWGNSVRGFKWGSGSGESLRNPSKNILNRGWVKAKIVCRGKGVQRGCLFEFVTSFSKNDIL